MPKYLDLENLKLFKTKQDEANAAKYATKESIPTKVSDFTNDKQYQTASEVAASISTAVASAYKYKGSVASVSALPSSNNAVGDVYNVEDSGMNYAWTGKDWDALGSIVDLSDYAHLNHTHAAATASAPGFMSAADKSKLDNIAAGANKTTVDAALSTTSTNPVQNNVVKAALDGKSDSSHTHAAATTSVAGFMSTTDKSKLDGIAAGAEVNQNAFSKVTVGSTTIESGAKTDTLTLTAGTNVTITPSTDSRSITIAAKDTTYGNATAAAAGLIAAADKSKLDGIASGANKTIVDTALNTTSTNPVQNKVVKEALDGKSDSGHTHADATTSAAGFMSASDKSKLDGISSISSVEINALFA